MTIIPETSKRNKEVWRDIPPQDDGGDYLNVVKNCKSSTSIYRFIESARIIVRA